MSERTGDIAGAGIRPGDTVYYAGDSMGAPADRSDVGTVSTAREDGMMAVRWREHPSPGWWVYADGRGRRHDDAFTFRVQLVRGRDE